MRDTISVILLLLCGTGAAGAASSDNAFDLFAAEALVVSASRQPLPLRLAPATVRVVTREDLLASGAQTLWDALRAVPGVDVMNVRTFHGEVSIRGLNRSLNNRTLVLLDGKTVLNGFYDFVTWEEIPVTLDEIDRIEIVEGPVSALYGANAINGVINLVTRTPEQLAGSQVSASLGERRTRFGTALHGRRRGKLAYKLGLGWREGNRFEDAERQALQAAKGHALLRYTWAPDRWLNISGGVTDYDVQVGMPGEGGVAFNDGTSGFSRADYRHRAIRIRAFWNWNRGLLRDMFILDEPNMDFDTYDLNLEYALAPSRRGELVVGGSYRNNRMRSRVFRGGEVSQGLWAVFGEYTWRARPALQLIFSSRLDRHPLTDLVFTPRLSAVYHPGERHVWRLSGGTAFRNPTLAENHLLVTESFANPGPLPNPPFETIDITFAGDPALDTEEFLFAELTHSGRFGRLQTTATAFHYRLRDIISAETDGIELDRDNNRVVVISSFDHETVMKTWGGELGIEWRVAPSATVYARYDYQHTSGDVDDLGAQEGGPPHKASGGARLRRGEFTVSVDAHWVAATHWFFALLPDAPEVKLDDHALFNAAVSFSFTGSLQGLSLGLSAYNLTDNRHYQILAANIDEPSGQNGELIRRRMALTASYRF